MEMEANEKANCLAGIRGESLLEVLILVASMLRANESYNIDGNGSIGYLECVRYPLQCFN